MAGPVGAVTGLVLALAGCVAAPVPEGPRLVSLHDATTEIIVGLGRGADLVAVMEPAFLSPAALAAVEGVPRLGAPVSAEALVALHPTAVLGTEDVPQHQPELAVFPGATWIDPAGLDGLWASIAAVGAAIDAPTGPYVAELRARVPEPVAGDVPVFVYDCCAPPFTMGGRAPLTEVLARLGARNVFAGLDQDWGAVSWEAVVQARPRLVIVDDYDGEGDASAKLDAVRAHLRDVRVVVVPLALVLEGPRVLEAVPLLRPAIEASR